MKEFLSSLFWPTLTGILAAAIILDQWVLPEPLGRDRSQIRTSYSDAVALATPSVVNIYTAKLVDSGRNQRLNDPLLRRFLGNSGRRQRVERSLGSGVILTAEGHIITN
ncbi:MAG: protease, partial [Halieaceae bacterium]|nr:protease [Halieaceae bacterium]